VEGAKMQQSTKPKGMNMKVHAFVRKFLKVGGKCKK
jgi:hypothetical protein